MKTIKMLLFDAFLLSGVFILLTGGTYFISPEVLETFRKVPKYHRALLSAVTLILLAAVGAVNFFGREEQSSYVLRFLKRLKVPTWFWVYFVYVIFAAVTAYSSAIRHHVFHSSFDFAIFAQAIWNTRHGSFLYSSIKGGICLLGDHFSPVLVLFAPLYAWIGNPVSLLVAQAILSISAVFPLYLIAKSILKDEAFGLLFVIAYALYLPLRNAIRFDFHPELFGDPLMLWAFYFMLRNSLKIASVFLLLALMTKEVACAPIAMFGLYCFFFQKKRLFGLFWFLFSCLWFLIVVKWIIPLILGEHYFYLSGNYMAWKEQGIAAFLNHMADKSSFKYLTKIFLPIGFLSFLSPSSLMLTFPVLFQNLTSRNPMTFSIFFHYTSFLTPFVFISAIYGFRNLMSFLQKIRLNHRLSALIASYWFIGAALLMMGVSEVHVIRQHQIKDNTHLEYVRKYLKSIPEQHSIRTHEFFAAHVSNRKELHIYENRNPKEGHSLKAKNVDLVIIDKSQLGRYVQRDLKRLAFWNYHVTEEHDGLYILQRPNVLHAK